MSAPVAGRRKGLSTAPSPSIASPAPAPSGPSWLDDDDGVSSVAASPSPFSLNAPFAGFPSPTAAASPAAFTSPVYATNNESADAGLPAFLRDVSAQPQAPPALGSTATPQSSSPYASPTVEPSSTEAVERQRRVSLMEELAALNREVTEVTRHVEVLQGEGHAAAAQVRELDDTLAALRAKEVEGQRLREERAAQVRRAADNSAAEEARTSLEGATAAFRTECHQRCQQELATLSESLQAQQRMNASLQRECEEMMSTTPEARCQATALEALQRRMQDGVRHLRQHFSQQCSSTVALSARTFLAAAREQRKEVFASDVARRAERLEHHHSAREAALAEFHEECRAAFQVRADALFGTLKASLEKRRLQAERERQQRLSIFHARLHTMTERGRAMMEHQVRTSVEKEATLSTVQRDAAQRELTLRMEELAQQRRAFLSRAEAEYQSLRATRADVDERGRVSAVPVRGPSTASLETLRRDAEALQTRLHQLTLPFRSRQQTAPSSSLGQPNSASFGTAAFSVDAAVARWRESVLALQQRREFLRRTIAELQTTTRSCSDAVQRGRACLVEQREEARLVRNEWEAKVRGQLATCLTVRNPHVPALASLSTAALETVRGRVGDLMQAQGSLRTARCSFAAEVSTWVQQVQDYRSSSERLLSSTFAHLEALRDKSVQAEAGRLALQSLQAQVLAQHRHVSQEAQRLAVQKQDLDAFVRDLHAGVCPAVLPNTASTPSPDQPARGQSTLIFNGAKSPLIDVTNATEQRRTCDPTPRHGGTVSGADASPSAARKVPAAGPHAARTRPTSTAATTTQAPASVTSRNGVGAQSSAIHADARLLSRRSGRPTATTTVSTSSGIVDLFGSDSPSPVMPSLGEHSGWLSQYPPASASGAYISVSPQTVEAAGHLHRRSFESDVDFTTELEPLGDDMESDIEPLPYR